MNKSHSVRVVTKDPGPHLNKFLLRYNHPIKIRWDFLILLFSIWNYFSLPVDIAFNPIIFKTLGNIVFNHIIDICFALDILFHFRTTITDDSTGTEITDPKQIAIKYIKNKFLIDLIATVPFDSIFSDFTTREVTG